MGDRRGEGADEPSTDLSSQAKHLNRPFWGEREESLHPSLYAMETEPWAFLSETKQFKDFSEKRRKRQAWIA